MFDKLRSASERLDEIDAALSTQEIATDPTRSTALMRERAELEEPVTAWRRWDALGTELQEARVMADEEADAEMRAMAREEIGRLEAERADVEARLRELMIPRDPRDNRDIVLEIRAGTGGEEAALWAGDLLRAYQRFADKNGFRVEEISLSPASQGGIKEVVVAVRGPSAFARFKHESGTHRVQRIPATESQGRIHTSACTVAVLAEAEEVDVEINPADLRIDTYRASGAGGQHVNRTDSAVRITHEPTGVVVQCQDERSQHKNRSRAMQLLRNQLYEQQIQAQADAQSAERKAQVGSGDRSERIRTYNFPQNRVTDHRIGLTLHALDQVMDGGFEPLFDGLAQEERARRLASLQEDAAS